VPRAQSLEELNQFLAAACRQDEGRHIQGREQGVGRAMALERESICYRCRRKASSWRR
jgi:hypothetical protein